MINNTSNPGLIIFDDFSIDRNLPKFKNPQTGLSNQLTDDDPPLSSNADFISVGRGGINIMASAANLATFQVHKDLQTGQLIYNNKAGFTYLKKDSLWFRIKLAFQFIGAKKFKQTIPVPELTIQDYFRSIKMNCEELTKLDDRLNGYVSAITHAEAFGQQALVEDLKERIETIKLESRMYSMGLIKVITEKQVIEFYQRSEKGIQLTWIRNFTRLIPANLLEIKKRADELEIFDNYVIMHYDPEQKSWKMTKAEMEADKIAEAERRKDPILFGVIRGSRKLYYLGSWEDEYCDLTLDKFIEQFGEEAINKNNINIDQY